MTERVEGHAGTGWSRRRYGTEESLGYLERILAGEPSAKVACACSARSAMNYAIVAALEKITEGLAAKGQRLDLVIVEKKGVADGHQ